MLAVANRRKAGCGRMTRALVEQRQPARHFEHALDDEHHVRPAGVVFVEAERDVVLQRPGQHAVAELGHLLAVLQHDRVLADEVDAGDVAVEVDAHAGPVEPRGDLLDVRRLAGAVIAGDHHPAVEGEAGEDGERRLAVEQVVRIEVRHVLLGCRIGRRLHVRIDAEHLAHGNAGVRQAGRGFGRCRRLSRIHHSSTLSAPRAKSALSYSKSRPGQKHARSTRDRPEWVPFTPACWRADNYRPE